MSNTKLALSFRIFKNGQLVREDKLTQGVIKIGKVPSAHLRIDDESVSRMHAIVEVTGQRGQPDRSRLDPRHVRQRQEDQQGQAAVAAT